MSYPDPFKCPQCGSGHVDRDEVDIGVGTQYGPWGCFECGWTERYPDVDMSALLGDALKDGEK